MRSIPAYCARIKKNVSLFAADNEALNTEVQNPSDDNKEGPFYVADCGRYVLAISQFYLPIF